MALSSASDEWTMLARWLLGLVMLGLTAATLEVAFTQRTHLLSPYAAASQAWTASSTPAQQSDEVERLLSAARELFERKGPKDAYQYLDGHATLANEPDVVYEKSVYALELRSYTLAESHLRDYIGQRPQAAKGYNALGYMLADNNTRLDEALALIEKALAISPTAPAIIDSHGWVLYRMGRLAQGLARIQEAVARSDGRQNPEMLAHLGELLWESGRQELAVDVWRTAWAIDSKHGYLTKTIERYAKDRIL